MLYSYRHLPPDIFLIDKINELPSTGLQHSCISISESATRMHACSSYLSNKGLSAWSVAVHELELQSELAGDSTISKYVLAS